jgi:predicted DNA-binding ribbon-helix-helix protein
VLIPVLRGLIPSHQHLWELRDRHLACLINRHWVRGTPDSHGLAWPYTLATGFRSAFDLHTRVETPRLKDRSNDGTLFPFGICCLHAGAGIMRSPVVKRSIYFGGRKTSVALEDAFWRGLKDIAQARQMTVSHLVGAVDAQRHQSNLSSALRLFVLKFHRDQIPDRPRREVDPR